MVVAAWPSSAVALHRGDPLVEAAGVAGALMLLAGAVAVLRGGRRSRPRAASAVAPAPAASPPAAVEHPTVALPLLPAVGGDTLETEVHAGDQTVMVALLGVRGDGPGPAFAWRGDGQAPPVAGLPVVLGERASRRLYLDLARCPDVLTVTGPGPDRLRLALRLAQQLLADGHEVTVLGDLFGAAEPAGCRRADDLSEVTGPDRTGVVIMGERDWDFERTARWRQAPGGAAPIVLGTETRARWSVRVAEDRRPFSRSPSPSATRRSVSTSRGARPCSSTPAGWLRLAWKPLTRSAPTHISNDVDRGGDVQPRRR
jgi:hypothetical protein